jgi:ketosteroid isomerase-like protein
MRVVAVLAGEICWAPGRRIGKMINHLRAASAALVAACLVSPVAHADDALDAVLAGDRAFATLAAESGTQAAFLEYLAQDSVLFRPGAVNGREWLQTHEEASGRLEWLPAVGAIACDRQLAVTVGPWTYRQGTEVASGHYLTIWRKDPAGRWAVVLDHGIDDAPGTSGSPDDGLAADQVSASWPLQPGLQCGRDDRGSDLVAAERKLNDAVRSKGLDAALRNVAGRHRISLRDDHAPAAPAAGWPDDDAAVGAPLDAVSRGAYAAPASSMGYSYGEIAHVGTTQAPGVARAVYVRIWAREEGAWRVAIDMLTLLPDAAGATGN